MASTNGEVINIIHVSFPSRATLLADHLFTNRIITHHLSYTNHYNVYVSCTYTHAYTYTVYTRLIFVRSQIWYC